MIICLCACVLSWPNFKGEKKRKRGKKETFQFVSFGFLQYFAVNRDAPNGVGFLVSDALNLEGPLRVQSTQTLQHLNTVLLPFHFLLSAFTSVSFTQILLANVGLRHHHHHSLTLISKGPKWKLSSTREDHLIGLYLQTNLNHFFLLQFYFLFF
jgi:hypothetical protein